MCSNIAAACPHSPSSMCMSPACSHCWWAASQPGTSPRTWAEPAERSRRAHGSSDAHGRREWCWRRNRRLHSSLGTRCQHAQALSSAIRSWSMSRSMYARAAASHSSSRSRHSAISPGNPPARKYPIACRSSSWPSGSSLSKSCAMRRTRLPSANAAILRSRPNSKKRAICPQISAEAWPPMRFIRSRARSHHFSAVLDSANICSSRSISVASILYPSVITCCRFQRRTIASVFTPRSSSSRKTWVRERVTPTYKCFSSLPSARSFWVVSSWR
mmetsp:Transcript_3612/g.6247  ORF Transcript_3612/g.6247 Transcript_3612/m.6247 type:complete len:273 (-) Transcript_3612:155-973(-)